MAIKLTRNHIRSIIKEALGEMTGYHGTGVNFAEFDDQHVSQGAGSQCFGWGTYITASKKIGGDYAEMTQTLSLTYRGQDVYDDKKDEKENFNNPYRLIYDLFTSERNFKAVKDRAQRLYGMVDNDNIEMLKLWGSVVNILKSSRASDWKLRRNRVLLTVDIPDDNGRNYLGWHDFVDRRTVNYIYDCLFKMLTDPDEYGDMYKGQAEIELRKELDRLAGEGYQMGGEIYNNLQYYCGGDKWASIFLSEIGFVGIRYKAGTINGGANKGDLNYVIFNPKDIVITNREMR